MGEDVGCFKDLVLECRDTLIDHGYSTKSKRFISIGLIVYHRSWSEYDSG